MDLSAYVEDLRRDLVAAATTGGDAMVAAAERLTVALDAAVRMALLEALADAAAEITAELPGGAIDVRLKGRDPHFVVTLPEPPTDEHGAPPPDASANTTESTEEIDDDDSTTARLTLRLPDALKQRVDAAATRARQSTNTWLVEVIRSAVTAPSTPPRDRPGRGHGRHLTGWVR